MRLPHSAWTYEAAAIDALHMLSSDDLQYLWLPLSHVFGKVLLTLPLQIGFPTAVDGRVDKIVENLAVVRPTFMGAAPRIFEKAHARVEGMMEEEGGAKKKIFDWAVGVGRKVSKAKQAGRSPGLLAKLQHGLADKLVFSTIRERFGGHLRFFISGSAALNPEVGEWFDAVGIPVLEGYGLTETSAATFVNRPYANRIGTVGWPVPGTEVRIAEDGEVLVRGPGVMTGYHNRPDATAESLSDDGWFHTGDIGSLDDEGYLRITDRKKDMFKTSQASTSPRRRWQRPSRHVPIRLGDRRLRRGQALLRGAGGARSGIHRRMGEQERCERVVRGHRTARQDPRTRLRLHRRSEPAAQSVGADQEVHDHRA